MEMKKSIFRILILFSAITLLVVSVDIVALSVDEAFAQSNMVIFPSKGQSAEQQDKDKYDCYSWAKKETGFDPMEQPKTTAPPPAQPQPSADGSRLKGAAKGALLGAAIGEIADDDAGKGAAIGAATGAVFGGMKKRSRRRQTQQAQQQQAKVQADTYAQSRGYYDRAYSACLEGRGYVVK